MRLLFCFICLAMTQYQEVRGDPVSEQLCDYKKKREGKPAPEIKTGFGTPVPDVETIMTAGYRGPAVLQDFVFVDIAAHNDRERIPERLVHGRGSGAFGYFKVTCDITKWTKAKLFSCIGKKTKIAVRLSLATGERGTPESVRDARGFAIKFYTEDGNWDLVGYNFPVFLMRDAMVFSQTTHVLGRNPVTNINKDPNILWDFFTKHHPSVRAMLSLFSSDGIPDGYRYMNGFGQNTFKLVNKDGKAVYCKFHMVPGQGVRNLSPERAANISAQDPDYATRDLYNAIATKNYPWWYLKIQVMTFEQAERYRWNPFDVTKEWLPKKEFPLIEVGKLVLNKNPRNYFSDVEQIAFCPAHLVPGIEPSPDKMLQGRLLAYSDTQRYRVGTNHLQLPVNRPLHVKVTNYHRDGAMAFFNQDGAPNYFPNSFGGPKNVPSAAISPFNVTADVKRYNANDDDNFSQPTIFWNDLPSAEKDNLANNIAASLGRADYKLQIRGLKILKKVSPDLTRRVEKKLPASGGNRC